MSCYGNNGDKALLSPPITSKIWPTNSQKLNIYSFFNARSTNMQGRYIFAVVCRLPVSVIFYTPNTPLLVGAHPQLTILSRHNHRRW